MKTVITVIQVAACIIIIVAVLLQQKGTGLSGVFGGSTSYYQTKRGAEKFLYYATIGSAVVFLLATMWQIFAK